MHLQSNRQFFRTPVGIAVLILTGGVLLWVLFVVLRPLPRWPTASIEVITRRDYVDIALAVGCARDGSGNRVGWSSGAGSCPRHDALRSSAVRRHPGAPFVAGYFVGRLRAAR
jgi:hypothetical protein